MTRANQNTEYSICQSLQTLLTDPGNIFYDRLRHPQYAKLLRMWRTGKKFLQNVVVHKQFTILAIPKLTVKTIES